VTALDQRRAGLAAVAFVALVLLVQIVIAYPRASQPLIDGRLHTDFDTAAFLLRAFHSNDGTIADWRKVFGVATYLYDDANRPVALDLYANHGVLSPLLLRLYAKVVGYSEWTTRSYSLLVSLLTTVAVFGLLRAATRRAALGFLLTLLYVLLPLKYMYLDRWKYEGMVELVIAATALCLVERERRRGFRYGFLAGMFLLFQTDYTAYLPAVLMVVYLFLLGGYADDRSLGIRAAFVAAGGVAVAFAIQWSLGFDRDAIARALAIRTAGGMDDVSLWDWVIRHVTQAASNLEPWHAVLMVAALVWGIAVRPGLRDPFVYLGAALVVSTFVYSLVFRNQSYIHHYVLWNYGLAYVLLLGGILGATPAVQRVGDHVWALVFVPVVALTWITASATEEEYGRAVFGVADDIAVIRTVNRRLVYLDDGASGPSGWWAGPVVQLYTDPVFRHSRVTGAGNIEAVRELSPDRDLVVARRDRQAVAHVTQYLKDRFGIDGVRVDRSTPTFVFLTFDAAAARLR